MDFAVRALTLKSADQVEGAMPTSRSKSSLRPSVATAEGAKTPRGGVKLLPAKAGAKRVASGELADIVERISPWAGGSRQALAWCEEVAIPALGGLTAEQLVQKGQARSVMAFLDHIAVGGFA